MKTKQLILEAEGATVAFAFGRFNPAHQGHIEVWRTVEQAGKNWFIGTNPSTLGPNDPLTFQQKSAWMAEIYPPIQGHIVAEQSVLTLAAYIFKKLRKNEGATVAYITDDTDWAWSGKLLNQYNGVEGSHGYYKFAQITHVPSPRVSSATALRDAARADDKVAFYHASGTDPKAKVAGLTYFDTVKQAVEKYPLPVKKTKKIKEDEQGEVEHTKGNKLIPWPAGTAKIHVSDVYDWYKLGQTISDLDDADPSDFGQGQPQTVIAFGSEEEESKLMPLLKRLGLRVDDIDPEGADIDEAYHAGALYDYLKNNKQDVAEGYGRYYCSTDKRWKERKGPKQTRRTSEAANPAQQAAIAINKKKNKELDEEKQRLDAKCWKGYKKQGTKMKGDTRVNNCVKESIIKEATYTKPEVQQSPKTGKFWAWVYNNKGEKLAYIGNTAEEAMQKLNSEVLDKHKAKVDAASKINTNAVYSTWITKEAARNKAGVPAGTPEIWVGLNPGKLTISKSPVAGFKKARLGGTQNSAYNILIKGTELEAMGIKPSNRYELTLTDQSKDGITSVFKLDLHSPIYDTNDKLPGANELPLMVIQNTGGNSMAKESALDEKSVSKAQFRTMAAVANNPEFAKKVGISQEVGKEFHSADKNTNYKKLPKKVDEILDPTSMSATVIRWLGRTTAKVFPMIMVGAVGGGLAYAGLLAPIIASMGGITAALAGLSAEVAAYGAINGAVAGVMATPSLVQIVKDLFAADEDSLRAGFKRWVEKHVGDENDVLEFMNLHAQSAYLKQPVFRWRAEEWKTKMKPDEAEAYLEKHNKGWLDAEKQKVIDAEKAKAEKEKADAEKANVKPGVKPSGTPVKPGFKPPVKPATESLDADQKRVGQVGGKERAKPIGQVLAKPTKQHPYKGRLVGEAEDFNGEYDDEAGMARSNLLTTGRAVAGLLKIIQDQDNLPEWGQEKIAKAEMMLVSIWDYLQSQKEQGIDPKIESVSEAEQDFGADWDEIVKRVGQRAKQGPLKTVWDPEKRVYKNVPVNDPDQPAKEVDEASLATMRDYFAGNDDAKDPTKLAQMRDFFSKNKLPGAKVQDKRFASKQAYELWLQKNGLKDLSSK